ncbi:MAG: NADH-dependent [FeFe] hydrogenase, group A6 [Bacillota bacterium]
MAKLTIDGQTIEINSEKNVLELVRKLGINLPTFCYHSELSVYGACRLCMVEEEKMGLIAACSTPPQDGMVIRTNTNRTRRLRRTVIELLLANHHRDCTTCEKNEACKLQSLAHQLGVRKVRFGERTEILPIDNSSPAVVRDPNKCILCGDCVRMCSEIQGIGVLNFANRGAKTTVAPAFNKQLSEVDCVNCGQCVAVCPTGALTVRSETEIVWNALHDPTKTVIAQVAPAVRVALSEEFGGQPGELVTGRLVAGLRRLGFAKVFDTTFTADLTAVEETDEFLARLAKGERLPQFTSCCPGWVKFCEQYYPELLPNVSTCKSPQQMFGSVAKRFYSRQLGVEPKDLFVVSIMPCTAKKFEARRPEFAYQGIREVDAVISTTELALLLKQDGIVFNELEDEAFDTPLGLTSGAGVLFGVTGGVAEAALRAASGALGVNLDKVEFHEVRGFEGIRSAAVRLGDAELKVAVVNGLGNARELIEKIKRGEVHYDLIEVMACPGGCVGGGGQPYPNDSQTRQARAKGLYRRDKMTQFRRPQDNLAVQQVYEKWLDGRHSQTAHDALHTSYRPRRRIDGSEIVLNGARSDAQPVEVAVCVGTGCYLRGSYDVLAQFTQLSLSDELAGRVNLKATFCLEHCDKGASLKVGDRIVTGVTPENAAQVFHKEVASLFQK